MAHVCTENFASALFLDDWTAQNTHFFNQIKTGVIALKIKVSVIVVHKLRYKRFSQRK